MQRVIHSVLACRVVLHIRERLSEEPLPTVPADEQYDVETSYQSDGGHSRVDDKGLV